MRQIKSYLFYGFPPPLFDGTRVWTLYLALARQALYHLSCAPSPSYLFRLGICK
jgi:hypothetical protein